MKDTEFARLNPLAGLVNDTFGELHKKGAFDEFLARMMQVVSELPEGYSISFDIQMNVFDFERESTLALLNTGLNVSRGREPYRHRADCSPQKYLVDGEICMVPSEYCPHCWGIWDFKFMHPVCPECGYELGREVKYLLDNDKCPHCHKGTVTAKKPKCRECGFKVDRKKVAWR